ncbi:NADH-quinone oxidoreductase subunit NuoE [Blochmannia endosymbiont of Colobopsis nipponica]|uniref:NADH-quinone oxidoreductase subunit NuoE n=1 Tax=Blochmannia endosymbiont of Colobopsis nipponica TaxID=2681987 RepID=UPI00177C4AAC|nr:NADH-quinone oxidoreductase subunit NuoE [Blochmannia endosymbiont of Colobopsis nipponica]QOI10975.1 NADH-quinone oxidoreductase subunit NuoE [Blochmannia endosymbiont of Colobopsis nipponica]
MEVRQDKINFIVNDKASSLNQEELDAIQREICHYEDVRSIAVEALKIVQKNRGWISDKNLEDIAFALGISSCELEEIATFYSQIFRKPVGQNIIRFCDSVVCYINGYKKIQAALEKILMIIPGQTDVNGKFTLLPTCCLGKCDQGPVIMVNDDMYVSLLPEHIDCILEKY